jgi:hypothetical protein
MAQVGVGQVRRFTEGSLYFFFDPLAVLADFFFDPLLALAVSSIVLIASTLEAFVKIAGAATNVSAANGLWANGIACIRFLRLKLYSTLVHSMKYKRFQLLHIFPLSIFFCAQ